MNRKVWENLISLLAVHILNYVAPLITLPFLARVLGPENWGKLAFAEAYANYMSLIIEYGFNLSATRDVARAENDRKLHSALLTNIVVAQLLLALAVAISTLVAVIALPTMRGYANLMPAALALALFRAITPLWYFQGIQRLRFVAALNVVVNFCSAGAILTLVHSSNQILFPLGIRALAAFAAAVLSFGIACQKLSLVRPNIRHALGALRDGWSIFLFKSAVSLYTTGNVILIGFLAPASSVAWFAGAEKVIKSATSAFSPITQAFYPRISNLLGTDPVLAGKMARISLRFTVAAGMVGGLVMFAEAPFIVHELLGPGYEPSIGVLRCLSALPVLIAASTVLGVQWMLPLRLDKVYTRIILWAGLLNLVLATILTPRFRQMGMAFSVTAAETLVLVSVIVALKRRQLDPWAISEESGSAIPYQALSST